MSKKPLHLPQEQHQHDLVESRQLFKTIFDHSPVAITVIDSRQRIAAWNPAAEQMLGMTKRDLFNKPVSVLYPPQEWKRLRSLHIRHRGRLSNIATKVVRKDGTLLDVSASIAILQNTNGKVIGSLGILHDMSRQKKVEEQLIHAKLAAEEANSAKSVFLAKMSHEVRTPANAIIGMIDLTLDTPLTDEQKDNLKVAKDAADHLLNLINDILDLSRAQAGKVAIEEVEINVADIVKNVCKGLTVLARNKGVEVAWSMDAAIPQLLIGDPVRLRQVLVNLLNNAIKFTNKGKAQVNARVKSLTHKDCEVLFEVIDEGIGIPKKNLPHIFDLFTEAHNSTARRYGGSGLGLAICKQLVEMMRGQITVESAEGAGSTFCFSVIFGMKTDLLLKRGDDKSQQRSRLVEALPPEVRHLRILVAEDNIVNLRITKSILEKLGWEVTAVSNGQEALNLLNGRSFDVVLMDDHMSVLNGVEATKVIRQEEKQTGQHVPIIAMTANAMVGDRENYLALGMDGYVSKPIDHNLLYEEIVNLVTKRLKS